MDYKIIKFVNGRPDEGSTVWQGHPLSAVQDQAQQLVEVRDEQDKLVYQWPRTLRPA